MEKKIPSKFQDTMYEIRTLIFIERYSFTNNYYQLKLTEEQLHEVMDLLESYFPHDKDGNFDVKVSEKTYDIPDLKDTYKKAPLD